MGKVLDTRQIEDYHASGIHFPLRAYSAGETAGLYGKAESTRALMGGKFAGRYNQKPHLLFPWLNELVRTPKILDAVEDVLGSPDILCWAGSFFAKDAGDGAFISWLQDATYWGLSSPDVVTAWFALTPSNVESGCMKVVPGTHRSQMAHKDSFHEKNLLTRGQEIAVEVNEADAVNVVLEPGEFSLHHVLLVHGSEPNRASLPRIGYAMRYIPPHLHQITGERDSATLVRGTDRFGHFDHEEAPKADMEPAAVERHAEIIEAKTRVLYRGAKRPGRDGQAAAQKGGN